jgi:hypothetical protein
MVGSVVAYCDGGVHIWSRGQADAGARCNCGQRVLPATTPPQPDPQAAALQMALQPNLASLDELLAAIRALQFQADQEIARLLEQNAELLAHRDRVSGRGFVDFQQTRRWLVVRKRETNPPEVHAFDRYDHAAVFFDRAQTQWSDTYFCAVVAGPEQPLRDIPNEWFFTTRTDADVDDDRRAIIDELPDDPDYTGGRR